MIYPDREGYLALEESWHVHPFAPEDLVPKGSRLVVARGMLPLGMKLADYISRRKRQLSRALKGFRPKAHSLETIDRKTAHFLEFAWENDGSPMNQIVGVIHYGEILLTLAATIPGTIDPETRDTLLALMKNFRPGAMTGTAG